MTTHRHRLDGFRLSSGEALPNAVLELAAYGTLNADRSNVILLPTPFNGVAEANEIFFGPGRAIDPDCHFIVVPNLLGNGRSSSPSHQATPEARASFPVPTFFDNARMQSQALKDLWGIERIQLVAGFSMGGCQALHWGVEYPGHVGAILASAATARTSPHNVVFLEGVKAALLADPSFEGGQYSSPPLSGLEAMGRVWCGWAFSQAWWRRGGYRELGVETPAQLLDQWGQNQTKHDANNLLCMLHTWQQGDVSQNDRHQGDLDAALASITARTILMPSSSDLYFRVKDCEADAARIPDCELRVHHTDWGHACRADTVTPSFLDTFDRAAADLLEGQS